LRHRAAHDLLGDNEHENAGEAHTKKAVSAKNTTHTIPRYQLQIVLQI